MCVCVCVCVGGGGGGGGVMVHYCCTSPRRYQEYIRESVYRSLPQAQLGGVPGTFQLVRSYLIIQQTSATPGLEVGGGGKRGDFVSNLAVFTLLRMGPWTASHCGRWCSTVCGVGTWMMPWQLSAAHSESC